jgi:hypothetical protein
MGHPSRQPLAVGAPEPASQDQCRTTEAKEKSRWLCSSKRWTSG